MVIEGTLGLVTSHFLLDLLRERGELPGFADGYGRIAADEQRHIAYGTWFLREAVAADPAMAEVITARISDLLPAVAESVSPPSEGAWDVLGVEPGALAEFGLGALTRRLNLIGVRLEGSLRPTASELKSRVDGYPVGHEVGGGTPGWRRLRSALLPRHPRTPPARTVAPSQATEAGKKKCKRKPGEKLTKKQRKRCRVKKKPATLTATCPTAPVV